ncbi:MAG: carboxypeptidase-like regulatory domain-containing protein, partial [Pseudomonadota bacterium]
AQTLPMQAAKSRAARWARSTAINPYTALMAEAKFMDYPFATLPIVGLTYSSGWARALGQGGLGEKEGLARTTDALNMQLEGTLFYAATSFGLGIQRNAQGDLSLTGGNLSLSRDAPSPTLLADWLGPLAARRIELGDIGATGVPLSSLSGAGRGLRMNNAPAGLVDDPDRFVLEGDAPAGWDVEVYQNASLLAFQKVQSNNRYRFQALPLRAGVNDFRIVLYGPRGEQETRTARYVLGDAMLARGQFTYDVSLYEPSVPVFALGTRQALPGSQPTLTQRYAYGLTSNLTAVLGAYTGFGDRDTTLGAPAKAVAAGLRGTLLGTYWQTEALAGNDETRRLAASLARQLPWGVGARVGFIGTYGAPDKGEENERIFSLDMNKAVDIGDVTLDNAITYRRTLPEDGYMTQAVQLRTGLAVAGFGITNEIEANWRELGVVQYDGDLALSRSLFGGYARVALAYRPNDKESIWRTADATYQRTLTQNLYFDARYQQNLQDDQGQRYSGRLDYQLSALSLGLTGYADSSGDYGGQLSLRTELQPGAKGYEVANTLKSRSFGAATVKLLVFIDDNGNQQLDPGEAPIEGVRVANLNRNSSQLSNAAGEMVFQDIPANMPVRLEVVDEELPDIYLRTPPRPLVVYGQAGAKGEYIIPLQRYGEINGMVMREGRDGQKRPVARLQLVVRNADGKAVARTRTEEDGFFILDNLPLGQYQVDIETTENAMKGLTMRSDARFTIEAKKYLIEDIEIFVNNED